MIIMCNVYGVPCAQAALEFDAIYVQITESRPYW